MQNIQHITHDQIDKQKWDRCIELSTNGLIYAYSWYLDACGAKWDALILDDYEAVMPLTFGKKYGIYYLFQPWFCAGLGVFGIHPLTTKVISQFFQAIPTKFRYVDICLNYENRYTHKDAQITERVSYIMSLKPTYEEIKKTYRTQLKRNLTKAEAAHLVVKWDIDINDIFPLAKEIMQRVSPISDAEVDRIIPLFHAVKEHSCTQTIGIYSRKDELLASAVFFQSHQRWYYLIVGNHPNGKTIGASHYLIDCFIQRNAGTDFNLDFEGSDIRNIAYFYSSFGAKPILYQAIKINRLPKIIRWLKK
jgi:hypothetical protein